MRFENSAPFVFLALLFLIGCAAPKPVQEVQNTIGQAVEDTAEAAEAARVGAIQAVGQREVKTTQRMYVNRLQPLGVLQNTPNVPADTAAAPATGNHHP